MARYAPHESALIVTVPEAEPVVADWRRRYDVRAVEDGVPAHLTVLYPFLSGDTIDDGTLRALAEIFAAHRAFRLRLDHCGRFPGVLYLAPADPAPLRALTAAVAARWLEAPPYGGRFGDPEPHLTVAQSQPDPVLDAVQRDLAPRLPVTTKVGTVRLVVHDPAGWREHTAFSLAHSTTGRETTTFE